MRKAQLHPFNRVTADRSLNLSEPPCPHLSGGNNNIHLKMLINNNKSYHLPALCYVLGCYIISFEPQNIPSIRHFYSHFTEEERSSERVVTSPKPHSWEESERNWTQICWL